MNCVRRIYTFRTCFPKYPFGAGSGSELIPAAITAVTNFSTTRANLLKEVTRTETKGVTVIEGKYVPSPRENKLISYLNPASAISSSSELPSVSSKAQVTTPDDCPLCRLGLPIAHTDVLILSQFVRDDGCILPARVTGLCKEQQKRISYLIAMAQKAGLMPNLNPIKSHKDPKKRFGWKKYNKYYEESIIDLFLNPKKKVRKA